MRGPQRLPGVNGFMYDHGSLPIIIEIEWMKIPIKTVLFWGGCSLEGWVLTHTKIQESTNKDYTNFSQMLYMYMIVLLILLLRCSVLMIIQEIVYPQTIYCHGSIPSLIGIEQGHIKFGPGHCVHSQGVLRTTRCALITNPDYDLMPELNVLQLEFVSIWALSKLFISRSKCT